MATGNFVNFTGRGIAAPRGLKILPGTGRGTAQRSWAVEGAPSVNRYRGSHGNGKDFRVDAAANIAHCPRQIGERRAMTELASDDYDDLSDPDPRNGGLTAREELLAASDAVIEDAVHYTDPMVLRGLLYQLTGDEEVRAIEAAPLGAGGAYSPG